MNTLQKIGTIILCLTLLFFLSYKILEIENFDIFKYLLVGSRLLLVVGIILIIPWKLIPDYIWDNKDVYPNDSNEKLLGKIRHRALLMKNISVIILVLSIFIIALGFYFILVPLSNIQVDFFKSLAKVNNLPIEAILWNNISIRFGAILLILFLIQILFRVFRYLLRIAAFYDGIADSIELHDINPKTNIVEFVKLLTPDKYDFESFKENSIYQLIAQLLKQK